MGRNYIFSAEIEFVINVQFTRINLFVLMINDKGPFPLPPSPLSPS